MDRKEYLNLCRIATMKKAAGKELPKVKCAGIEYAPIAYQLSFTSDGSARHTAVLLDNNGKCVVKCPLDKVTP